MPSLFHHKKVAHRRQPPVLPFTIALKIFQNNLVQQADEMSMLMPKIIYKIASINTIIYAIHEYFIKDSISSATQDQCLALETLKKEVLRAKAEPDIGKGNHHWETHDLLSGIQQLIDYRTAILGTFMTDLDHLVDQIDAQCTEHDMDLEQTAVEKEFNIRFIPSFRVLKYVPRNSIDLEWLMNSTRSMLGMLEEIVLGNKELKHVIVSLTTSLARLVQSSVKTYDEQPATHANLEDMNEVDNYSVMQGKP